MQIIVSKDETLVNLRLLKTHATELSKFKKIFFSSF